MSMAGFAWECNCGHVEYAELEPEECPKCSAISSFLKLPEEILREREKDLSEDEFEITDIIQKKPSLKKPSTKVKKTRKKKK